MSVTSIFDMHCHFRTVVVMTSLGSIESLTSVVTVEQGLRAISNLAHKNATRPSWRSMAPAEVDAKLQYLSVVLQYCCAIYVPAVLVESS